MIARRVLDAIDDALIIANRHPVLFASASKRGLNCAELANLYNGWLLGSSSLPSWAQAFNASSATFARRKVNRRLNKAARVARRAGR